tara:strand:- start:341 stop:553 length:213 start_codon:yes stop_codon:yes gene_type:complete
MEHITPEKVDLMIGMTSAFIIFIVVLITHPSLFSEVLAVETKTYTGVVYDEGGNTFSYKSFEYTGKVWRR